jgi:DNA polymerase-3 subunit delta
MATDGIITSELVESNVGNWRMRKVWDMIDEAADGNAASALRQLDRLISAGEEAVGLLAQIASPLRRYAAAIQILERAERIGRRVPLREALREAGVKPFALEDSERRLRQIGRQRGRKLFRWLLDADLAIKGESSAPPRARLVLEELIVRLSKQASPAIEGRSEAGGHASR